MLDRRQFIAALSATASFPFWLQSADAANPTGQTLHGLSAFGELQYPAGFTHFGYANPEAPQGGTFNFSPPNWQLNQNVQTFNTLNTLILNGDAPPRMELCFDALMVRAIDEPDAIYCHLANTVEIGPDRNSYTFALRPEAKWHDGTPLTAHDVAFSYNLFKDKAHPAIKAVLTHFDTAEALDTHTVRLVFDGQQSDRAILSTATLPVVSKDWYSAHDFSKSSMTPPLGSGPYQVGNMSAGAFIEYDRVSDYWANNLPTMKGLYHFDKIRIDFYSERQVGFEAFKKGEVTWREEFTSKVWATGYDFPAVKEGRVKQKIFSSEKLPTFQAWALNQRRTQFADPRVRQAINFCFDFNWTNENIFYGAYRRAQSLFANSEFEASGLPDQAELKLLEPLRGELPEAAFGQAVLQPESDGSGQDRSLLKQANDLLMEAGWQRDGTQIKNANGKTLDLEILIRSEVFTPFLTPFVNNLRILGINASSRLVDPAQYQLRLNEFDFDMTGIALGLSATPTEAGMGNIFSSQAAGQQGSRNLPGIKSPAIDSIIEQIGKAKTRQELVVAMRVLDRILRARGDWLPNWLGAGHRIAYWDMYGFADSKPDYQFPVEALWWLDKDKADALGL